MTLLAVLPAAAARDASLGAVPGPATGAWWTAAVVLVAQAAAVAEVARHPGRLLPAVAAVPLVLALVGPSAASTLTAVAVLVAVHLAAVHHPPARLRAALVVTALLVAVGQAVAELRAGTGVGPGTAAVAGTGQALVVVGLPLLLGSLVAARRQAERARRQEVAAVRREQDALLAAAAARERTAMSRELHDIAAHHLSGIALLAGAVERQVATDPDAARASARLVREQSRSVLDDLRRLVGLLREDGDGGRPVETLAALEALVRRRREAGADVVLVTDPPAGPAADLVGPLAQLVAHRMVQEALANAAAHAPGAPCVVEVALPAPDRLLVTVRNGPPPAGRGAAAGAAGAAEGARGGFGLVGMAERAQLVGGELAYGPAPDGGWRVRLGLPVETDRPEREDPLLADPPEAP
ncbi:sensor histidine kinase [Cellulomonas endophytica]|uniref:sensor histidine kinase n=1 Tax=Cellulomonas endophytica TaxID=2494735 RepID=UPI001013766F|nr:histidine kinase [Cellulomonas endophytica]